MEKITAEKAQKLLKSNGADVTIEQAKIILQFLQKIANLAVSNHLNKSLDKKLENVFSSYR